MNEISKDAQIALNDLGSYSMFYGASKDEREAGIADEAKEFLITHIAKLESQLAATQARLAAYEEGYDPATNPPEDNRTVLIVVDSLENEPSMYLANFDGSWFHSVGYSFKAERVVRWYSVMGAKEEE